MSRLLSLVTEARSWRLSVTFARAAVSAFTVLALMLLGTLPAAVAHGLKNSEPLPQLSQESHTYPIGSAPLAPKPVEGQSLAIHFDAITPSSFGVDGNVTITATITNTSDETIESPLIQLGVQSEKPNSRSELAKWTNRTDTDDTGQIIARTARPGETSNSPLSNPKEEVSLPLRINEVSALAPGKSAKVSFQVPGRLMPFDRDPSAWGPRPMALSVLNKDESKVLAVGRSFLIWMPQQVAPNRLQYSFMLPITTQDSADPVRNPEAFTNSVQSGRLNDLMTLASTPGVNWLLDPALLDPPVFFDNSSGDGADNKKPDDDSSAPGEKSSDNKTSSNSTDDKTSDDEDKKKSEKSSAKDDTPQALPASRMFAQRLIQQLPGRGVMFMPYQNTDLVAVSQIVPTATSAIRSELQEGKKRASATIEANPQSTVILEASRANTEELHVAAHANTQAMIVPSINLPKRESELTPSGVGQMTTADDRALPILTPDTVLSTLFTQVDEQQQVRGIQRILAETAFIASEPTSRPRHILISPPIESNLNGKAASVAVTALSNAGWLTNQPLENLVKAGTSIGVDDAQINPEWGKQGAPVAGPLLTSGHINTLRPASFDGKVWKSGSGKTGVDNGDIINSDQASTIESVNLKMQKLATAQAAFTQPKITQPLMRQLLSLVGPNLRSNPDDLQADYSATMSELRKFYGSVKVVPVSSYNLVASSAGVPITVKNDLPTGVSVKPRLTSDKKILKISSNIPDFTVPAHSQASVTVPVEAITSGKVNLEIQLNTANDVALGEPTEVALVVNPEWENTTTLIIVLAMTVLVVVGVFRAKNNRSSARAPSERGAESLPEEITEKDPV